MKKCKICRNKFEPRYSSLQPTCNESKCMAEYGRLNRDKFVKSEMKQLKEKTLDRRYYLKLAQTTFNTYIRLRDKGLPCVSCNRPLTTKHDAGHFYARGSFPNLRFEELNCHSQCVQCNRDRAGNLLEYREGLIKRIGQDKFDELEVMKRIEKHYSIDELKEIIQTYRNKIKTLNQ